MGLDMLDDSLQIRCPKCKAQFRDKARRVVSGYSKQCPRCEVMIFYEDGATDKSIARALLDAKRLRRALTEEAEAGLTTNPKTTKPYNFGR